MGVSPGRRRLEWSRGEDGDGGGEEGDGGKGEDVPSGKSGRLMRPS